MIGRANYSAAFVIDLDGNNLEAVCHAYLRHCWSPAIPNRSAICTPGRTSRSLKRGKSSGFGPYGHYSQTVSGVLISPASLVSTKRMWSSVEAMTAMRTH